MKPLLLLAVITTPIVLSGCIPPPPPPRRVGYVERDVIVHPRPRGYVERDVVVVNPRPRRDVVVVEPRPFYRRDVEIRYYTDRHGRYYWKDGRRVYVTY